MSMNLKRKTGKTLSHAKVWMDPRCWRTLYWIRRLYWDEHGFEPTKSYMISEILVDPERGARILLEAKKRYSSHPCPPSVSPRGNRHSSARDPNKEYPPGKDRSDWG